MKKQPPILLAFFAAASAATAQNNWQFNTAAGNWNDPANWNVDASFPDNDRFVNNGGIATINADTNQIIRDTKIGMGAATSGRVDHSAGHHNTPGWVFVGNGGGTGTYNLANTGSTGGTFTNFGVGSGSMGMGHFRIAEGSGSTGVLNMNTTGTVTTSGPFYVGTFGAGATGTMNFDGGTINSTGFFIVGNEASTGHLNMSGGSITTPEYIAGNRDGAAQLPGGTGFVNQTGGTATGNNWVILGRHSGTAATYNLSGNAVLRTTNAGGGVFAVSHSNNIGGSTSATLNISDNAVVTAANELWVGNGPQSTGVVNQNGGTVTANNWLAIGRESGNGTYNLNAGTLNHGAGNHTIIGSLNGVGVLTQKGTSVYNETNELRLGEGAAGAGTYDAQGGTGNIGGNMVVGWVAGGTGVFNLNGATVNANNVFVGGDGGGSAGNGTVNLNSGILFTNSIQHINNGGGTASLNFNGATLRARSGQGELFSNFTSANSEILAGGAVIDTNGFNVGTGLGLDGIGGLTKLGAGTLTLNGVSTYSGATIISQGTLALGPAGSLNPSSSISVAASAALDISAVAGGFVVPLSQTLSGNGTVTGNATINGTVSPGTSVGTLTFSGNLNLNGETLIELDRTGAPVSDRIVVSGILDYGGALDVNLTGGTLQLGDTFDIFDAASFTDSFSALSLPTLSGDWSWENNLGLNGSLRVIPESSTAALGLLAILGLLTRRRR
jgi:fibronectin-binding autotransporter adhesin